jgi:hypothetical protein
MIRVLLSENLRSFLRVRVKRDPVYQEIKENADISIALEKSERVDFDL